MIGGALANRLGDDDDLVTAAGAARFSGKQNDDDRDSLRGAVGLALHCWWGRPGNLSLAAPLEALFLPQFFDHSNLDADQRPELSVLEALSHRGAPRICATSIGQN